MNSRTAALDIRDLDVAYGSHRVIRNFSAGPLEPGRIIALLGPNGSGKSSLLKALAGIQPARHGQVLLDGTDLLQMSFTQRAQSLVYMPQSLPEAVHLRVFESVLAAARASRLPHAQDHAGGKQTALHQEIMAVLERLGIGHLAMRFLDQLSGGQKQLAGLAQALIRKPRLLLLDEPLSALDLNYQCHVMDLLRQETREHKLITVIVLHDLNMALQRSDQALLIDSGRLLSHGLPHEVITAASLAHTYHVRARIESCSQGRPHVMIDGLLHAPRTH